MSHNSNVVLFGSFSEEETKKIQMELAMYKKSEQKTYLQFGSLHFKFAVLSTTMKSESKKPDHSLASESLHNSKKILENQKSMSTHSNGNSDNCSLISKKHPENGEMAKILNPAASVIEGVLETEDSSGKSLADVISTTTNKSVENDVLDPYVNLKNGLQKFNFQEIPNSDNCSLISKKHPENGEVANVLNPAASVIEGVLETEDSSGKCLADVISTTTKRSLENDTLDPCVNLKNKLPSSIFQEIRNGDAVALNPLLPRGLINSGNLCFLNASLQALLSCSPFVELLQHLRKHDIPKIGFQTLNAFVEFISNFDMPRDSSLKKNDTSVIEIGKSFISNSFEAVLKKFTPHSANNTSSRPRQEDAQEFLTFVMHQMHDELLNLDGNFINSNGHASSMISSADVAGWATVGPKNKPAVTRTQTFTPSELSNIFGGQLRSVVKARGNQASATVQPFLLLHLDISSNTVCTIEDALHRFSLPEILEGYKAEAGNSASGNAIKAIKIQTVPKILILHLMRFSYGSRGVAKIHKPVRFSPELVLNYDLLVYPTLEMGRRYELVASITHHGRDPSKGHYTSDARHSSGKWLRYDDASVTSVSADAILHDQAYVLFYKQKN
ncbi:Ubiquitin carboxyl-terminal hydrolase 24 [Zostera marina]|uniref:ubiquitinyl hydrolase 1 n=1 Tax=Zostera marina TaxID=29655 RepID=A0A0K9P952_ZOSMR|nr:Ubiquitin carboxyl-terminal hydrolase 24 [Zostera marina]